jgi:hypothetical protein
MPERTAMGRFSVEFAVANNRDVVGLPVGEPVLQRVKHVVLSGVVEPQRNDALIGAIVLEELDLLVDCATQSLYPREPDSILTEIE